MRPGNGMDEGFLVFGESGNRRRPDGGGHGRRNIPARLFYAITGALCLWILAYGSGLFPWLGAGERDETSGPFLTTFTPGSNLSIGIRTMLLFEGQTAFYEYESTSPQGEITLDVRPVWTLGYSERMQRLRGAGSGRIEFPITRTGFYTFRHSPALGRPWGRTTYAVSWGAK